MKKSWGLIPKILSGEKTIESRWYQTRRIPWNAIAKGDTVFFKNSGEEIVAKASVSKVLQFELGNSAEASKIIGTYGKKICMVEADPRKWRSIPTYCILMLLESPQKVSKPFNIDKKGFGSATAWITVSDIANIRIS